MEGSGSADQIHFISITEHHLKDAKAAAAAQDRDGALSAVLKFRDDVRALEIDLVSRRQTVTDEIQRQLQE